jgi:superfamily I DNA and/or RNA helicase
MNLAERDRIQTLAMRSTPPAISLAASRLVVFYSLASHGTHMLYYRIQMSYDRVKCWLINDILYTPESYPYQIRRAL